MQNPPHNGSVSIHLHNSKFDEFKANSCHRVNGVSTKEARQAGAVTSRADSCFKARHTTPICSSIAPVNCSISSISPGLSSISFSPSASGLSSISFSPFSIWSLIHQLQPLSIWSLIHQLQPLQHLVSHPSASAPQPLVSHPSASAPQPLIHQLQPLSLWSLTNHQLHHCLQLALRQQPSVYPHQHSMSLLQRLHGILVDWMTLQLPRGSM